MAPSKPGPQHFNPTPCQMRALVINYLSQHCYSKTVDAFLKESTVHQLDADGDEVMTLPSPSSSSVSLSSLDRRQEIRLQILTGHVEKAVELLNTYFPSVLSISSLPLSKTPYTPSKSLEPAPLLLNLRILAFIEQCRTIPLPYPPPSAPAVPYKLSSDSLTLEENDEYLERATAQLKSADKLYALVRMLPNVDHQQTFQKELNNVCGLLAYKVPENSSLSKYLSQDRRDAVAELINSAILYRLMVSPISYLEHNIRLTSTVWSFLHDLHIKPRSDALLPPVNPATPSANMKGISVDNTEVEDAAAPRFDLKFFLDNAMHRKSLN